MNTFRNSSLLEIKNIKKSFGDIPVLDGVNMHLGRNEFVSLLGVSGSGKSTLFNIISGLMEPDEGKIFIEDADYTGRTGRVSYMYQKDLLLPWRKIIDNVSLPLVVRGEKKKVAREKVAGYFKTFGLEGFEYKYPFQLSGGMRQRAALLRTWLFSKDIMLLDEPFGGLDAITKFRMQEWLMEVLSAIQASVLLITHDIEEAVFLSDRIYVLSERPASIKEEIEIKLEKPRSREIITKGEFNTYKKHIYDLLL